MTALQVSTINPQINKISTKPLKKVSNINELPQALNGQKSKTACKDGNDDGKISAGQKAKNFGKGCLKLVTGMFTDKEGKFSIKKTLCTLGVVAAGAVLTVATAGTATAGFLACASVVGGVVGGGVGIAKGAIKASKAQTDAEAEEAWQAIGTGTAAIGVAIAGSKGAMSVAKGVKYDGNCLSATKDCFKFVGNSTKSGATNVINSIKAGTFRSDASLYVKDAKNIAVTNIDNTVKTSKIYNIHDLNKEIDKLRNTDGTIKAGCEDRLVSLDRQKQILKSRKYKITKVYSAEEANEMLRANNGCTQNPYLEGTKVYELKMKKEVVFSRTYDGLNSKQQGGWVMAPEDVLNLTPAQIQNKYALPQEPKFITDVYFNKGDVLRSGSVNPLEGWGAGGGVQFDLNSSANKGFIGKFINQRTL